MERNCQCEGRHHPQAEVCGCGLSWFGPPETPESPADQTESPAGQTESPASRRRAVAVAAVSAVTAPFWVAAVLAGAPPAPIAAAAAAGVGLLWIASAILEDPAFR